MEHIPVLKSEIVHTFSYLSSFKKAVFVDGTLGEGNHSIAIALSLKLKIEGLKFIGIDKDQKALDLAKNNIYKNGLHDNFIFVHDDFKNVKDILVESGINKIDGALLDLGVSSMQLDDPTRGFSFKNPDEELDMRMDQTQTFSVKDIVNSYSKFELEKIIRENGEEKYAKRIAENITAFRKEKSIKTVGDLLETLEHSIPEKEQHRKIHFATKTFQAIRIEVNHELEGLDQAIIDFVDLLSPKSKFAVITFHSLEDRIAKQTFNKLANPCTCPKEMPCVCGKKPVIKIITKKPITASEEELLTNPRSRSAKLRIIEKL